MPRSNVSTFLFTCFVAIIVYHVIHRNYSLNMESYSLPFPPKLEGPLLPNEKLSEATYILKGAIKGPESLYIEGGTADGKVVKIVDEKIVKSYVFNPHGNGEVDCDGSFQTQPICGRPMGIKKFDETRMIVADAYLGIFLLDLDLENAEHIVKPSTLDNKNGVNCAFFNDIAVLDNDTILFSSSSTRWGVGLAFHMLLEHHSDGKIYHYTISTKSAKIIAENFSFANGIELNQNKTMLFIAETGMARIWKLALQDEAKPEILIENLPALPDNIRATSSGSSYLVGLAVHRPENSFSIFDFMGSESLLRRIFIQWIPDSWINTLMPKMTKPYGFVIEFTEDGKIINSFQDPSGKTVNYISEAVESDGFMYLGSFKDDYIAKVKKD